MAGPPVWSRRSSLSKQADRYYGARDRPYQRAAIEGLLGRPLQQDEGLSILADCDRLPKKAEHLSEKELDALIDEAHDHARR
jgi:hypothetical protein